MKTKAVPVDAPLLRALALGAGVQSTTIALMCAEGELCPIDLAIFADTASEPAYVYDHLRWLQSPGVLPFPVEVVSGGDLGADLIAGRYGSGSGVYPSIPYFLDTGRKQRGQGLRACTGAYKMRPIGTSLRRRIGVKKGKNLRPGSIEVWIGISTDEAHRMKTATHPWQINRWPLIELGMSRVDCIRWLTEHGYQVPKRSACTFCPYRSDKEWNDLKRDDAAGFRRAVDVDAAVRRSHRLPADVTAFLHRSLQPLESVNFKNKLEQADLFGNECEGICGS